MSRTTRKAGVRHGAMTLRLFGGFSACDAQGRVVPISAVKNRALLAMLARAPNLCCTRERLAGQLWGDRSDAPARANLRQALTVLRRELGALAAVVLDIRDDAIGLGEDVGIDTVGFLCHAAASDLARLRQAAALYQGDFLEGLDFRDQGLNDWADEERRFLRETAIRLFDRWVALESGAAQVAAAQRLLALDPMRERSYRLLMQSYAVEGERALALREYAACKQLLQAELGVQPARETQDLARQIAGATADAAMPFEPTDAVGGRQAIAVLPFENFSQDRQCDFLADGLTDDIITELARFHDLLVIDRSSSVGFKGKQPAAGEVGIRLGVRHLVQGSLRRYGARLRIAVRLIEVTSKAEIWAEHYDRPLDQMFAVQDELVGAIAGSLAGMIERRARAAARRKPTEKLGAYECLIQGRAHFFRMLPGENQIARSLFQQAIEIDANYAAAHAWLAETHLGDWAGAWTPAPRASLEQGLSSAATALALDDSDSRTHATYARAICWLREFERARYHFDRALAINPSDTWALVNSARCFMLVGESERALADVAAAKRVNPLGHYGYQRGMIHYAAQQYDVAIEALQSVRDPIDLIYAWLAASLAKSGRRAEARAAAARYHASFPANSGTTPALYLAERFPFRRAEDCAHFTSGLLAAGVIARSDHSNA